MKENGESPYLMNCRNSWIIGEVFWVLNGTQRSEYDRTRKRRDLNSNQRKRTLEQNVVLRWSLGLAGGWFR